MGSTSQSFSLWGEMPGYWLYALVWTLVPWSGVLLLLLAKRSWTRQGRSDFLQLGVMWENSLLQMLQFLYVPVGLAVLRLVNCDADGRVSVDPNGMSCRSAGHVTAVVFITCGMGGGFLVGLPWILRRRIREALVHSSVEKHERFIQGKELEFMLGTSDTYLELYMPQFASFRRRSVEMPIQMCLLKLAFMVVFSVLRSPPPSIANQGVQGALFFFGVVSIAFFRTWRHPYRCISTSYLAILVDWMLVANGVFVLLCSNGVRSALTVSTSVTSSLTFLNSCFLVLIGLKELHDIVLFNLNPQKARTKEVCWPVNAQMNDIADCEQVASWVKVIHNAQNIILASLLIIPSMRSCEDLKHVLDQVELSYEEALARDHLLMLSLYVNELYVEAVASSPFHRSGFSAKELADLSGVLQRRKDRQLLLSTRNQRILKKLHITKSWSRRARPYASATVDGGWKRSAGIQEFLNVESRCQQSAAVAGAPNWKAVNSVISLSCDDGSNSTLLIIVLAWNESFGLVRWCASQSPSASGKLQEQYFSLVNARQSGIRGEVVSCGDATNTTALLQALATPITADAFKAANTGTFNGFPYFLSTVLTRL
ncbi:unnamed protein product [Phytophthora lilii]|uniref:Unnamed protein product n=1 Tax=Phytophthora lilii TaxID=2077276 RepID=A0A9W6U861_9STRA|nr:unnamed protein product [Phytophthora lilii]